MSPPPHAWAASLAGFERMTSARLSGLLAGRSPQEAFAIATGSVRAPEPIATLLARDPSLAAAWRRDGERRPPADVWQRCLDARISVVTAEDDCFPPALLGDPRRPPVLFLRGDPSALGARRVGIVGTRNATQRGREIAARFGYELAAAGVAVVSGLALGIDGAAHRGALDAAGGTPIAVVGSGPDVVYPRRHAVLWERVIADGLLISEWPPGTEPDAFRFPLRNRILAALSEVLLVVESRESGGSLITAREAAERGVDVMAVPGSIDARASRGTNDLLRDGASPATDPDDVLVALGLDGRRAGTRRHDPRRRPTSEQQRLIVACRESPATLEVLAERIGMPLASAALAAARLEQSGWLRETAGWFEAVEEWGDLA